MQDKHQGIREAIQTELASTRNTFHQLLGSLSESDLRRKSYNPSWTNGEILAHMIFGFIILNALLPLARLWGHFPKWTSKILAWVLNLFTVPFNWINGLGARLQARAFTPRRMSGIYDWAYYSLMKQIESIKDDEWERGMYYPTRWDSNFNAFMTIRELFHYPVKHFSFHMEQIAR